jgi:ABC-2 type transport system ATP-binding protein
MTDDMARLENLRIRRPDFEVADISFTVPRGSVVGLVGPNGAGKTTIIRSLLGLVAPDSGTAQTVGHDAGSAAALARTGVVLDKPIASPDWRVSGLGRRLAPFYPDWDHDLLTTMLDRLGVPQRGRIGDLSRGQGIKLTLATALAQRPDLLILDEPSSGLDPASRREITDIIREFMIDPDHATLLSTHITTDLDDLADHLIVMVGGRIAHRGPLDEARDEFAVARGAGAPPARGLLGLQRTGDRWSALIKTADTAAFGSDVVIDSATVDDIIIHLAAEHEETAA